MVWWNYGGVQSIKQILLLLLYNTLAFIFLYTISLSAKKQLEQREKLEETVGKLKKSKLELEDAYEKLLISNKKVQEITIVEERNRMAREIHDTLAHTLTSVIVEIEAGKKMIKKGAEGAVEELEKAQNQARIGLDEVRHSVKNLRSGILNKEGFEGALRITLEQLKAMGEVEIKFQMADDVVINEEYEMALFRIIQEASTNSCRHGKSNNIFIDLVREEDNILLTISDDGIGCEKIKYGYGILGIKERVKKLGGTAQIESAPLKGFTIRLILPIKGAVLVG
jgi:signal transduction histidine kinase